MLETDPRTEVKSPTQKSPTCCRQPNKNHIRFHSLAKRTWVMPSAPLKQTYFRSTPQGARDSHMRFHSLAKRTWVMPSAPLQQTYFRPTPQRARDSHMRFHSLAKRTWVMPSAPVQQTYFRPTPHRAQDSHMRFHSLCKRLWALFSVRYDSRPTVAQGPEPKTATLSKRIGPCPMRHKSRPTVVRGSKHPNSHMRFCSLPKRIWVMLSAP